VLIFAHDVVVTLTRYIVEDLDEKALLEAAAKSPIGNASLSSWSRRDGLWTCETFNDVSHLEAAESAQPTEEEPADEP
jgi:2,3-bisphosphoglycerate-dependent phosphoglycerate mutase